MGMIVILSYFHTKIGPSIFYSFPKTQLDTELLERIYDVMDQPSKEEFLTQSFENVKLLNYYFHIYSDWARGKKEMVMVSIMINQQISPDIEKTISFLCKNFSEKMQTNENLFMGFHIRDIDNHNEGVKEEIRQNESVIKSWVQDLYWEILEDTRKISEEEKITLLLDDRYIFESLEQMSREVKKISEEISLKENSLNANSNIREAVSNLNRIIEDLNEGYIEKMTEVDIEEENSLLVTEDEEDATSQKSKKELLQVLEGEFSRNEK
jgi:hypothetical protein